MQYLIRLSRWLASNASLFIIAIAIVTFFLPDLFLWVRGNTQTVILGIISLADQLGDDAVAEKGRSLCKVIIAVYVIAIIGVASYTFVLINPALAVIAYVIVCVSMVVSIVSYFLYLSLLSKAKKMLAK